MLRRLTQNAIGLLCFTSLALAASPPTTVVSAPTQGISYLHTLPVETSPSHLHGYQLAAWYEPSSFNNTHFHILFDAGLGHWWVSGNVPNSSLYIVSVSPIFRLYLNQTRTISPFIHCGIGLAYLSKTRLEKRNLGLHFSFQDQIGFGTTLGKNKHLSLIAGLIHYSNGSLSNRNAGITVPLFINIEYGF